MAQEQKPREPSFISELVPDWRPTREQCLWTARITIVFVVLLILLSLIGLPFGITPWDWLELLIVPIVLALGGYLFTRSENRRAQEIADQRRELDQQIADQRTIEDRKIAQERAETDRQIAAQRKQDDILQAYLDQMGNLLLDKERPLRQSKEGDEVRTLARARTLTVLERLDASRKTIVMRFLIEGALVGKKGTNEEHLSYQPVVDLSGVDLSEVNLSGVDLSSANLNRANLNHANLRGGEVVHANLRHAHLLLANLSWANLSHANLDYVDLRAADLSKKRS